MWNIWLGSQTLKSFQSTLKYMKRCATSLQIRLANAETFGQYTLLARLGGNMQEYRMAQPLWRGIGGTDKMTAFTFDPAIPLLGIYPENSLPQT